MKLKSIWFNEEECREPFQGENAEEVNRERQHALRVAEETGTAVALRILSAKDFPKPIGEDIQARLGIERPFSSSDIDVLTDTIQKGWMLIGESPERRNARWVMDFVSKELELSAETARTCYVKLLYLSPRA